MSENKNRSTKKTTQTKNKGVIGLLIAIIIILLLGIGAFMFFYKPWVASGLTDDDSSSTAAFEPETTTEKISLAVNETYQIEIELKSTEKVISYVSDFPAAVSVSNEGLITANAKQDVVVSAVVLDEESQTVAAYRNYEVNVKEVEAREFGQTVEVAVGDKFPLSNFIESGRYFAAISDNENVIQVSYEDSKYVAEALAQGNANLIISYGIIAEHEGTSMFLVQDKVIVKIVVSENGESGAGVSVSDIQITNNSAGSGSGSTGGSGSGSIGGSGSGSTGGSGSGSTGGTGSGGTGSTGGGGSSSTGGGGSSSTGGGGSSSTGGGGSSSTGGGGSSSTGGGGSSSTGGTSSDNQNILDVEVGGDNGLGVQVGDDGIGVDLGGGSIGIDIGAGLDLGGLLDVDLFG